MRRDRTIIGTAAQCRERIAELADACGLTGWMLHINYGGVPAGRVLEEMRIFSEEVAPAFAEPEGAAV